MTKWNNWRMSGLAVVAGIALTACGGGAETTQNSQGQGGNVPPAAAPSPAPGTSPPTDTATAGDPAPTTGAPATGGATPGTGTTGTPGTAPTPAPAATGTATLSWSPPTQNTDGSALTDLAGYWIYHGISADALNEKVRVSSTTYTFSQLAAGTHYFAVSAYNSAGAESSLSTVGSKQVM